ncbi:hypothetical protein ACFO26_09290 [Lactococcus nasutitermitis]|uniref:Uncharacterized protein n=1 Tax=Lactococcus nasutitermitis TaxID=1652957 RepID=A0ABV9JF11_9LACT|nr:hypothetical protein [Lactococcus nasutitermitis]
MNNFKIKLNIASLVVLLSLTGAMVVQASTTLFTYQGWGISYVGLSSLSKTYLSKTTTITVHHKQQVCEQYFGVGLKVYIEKSAWYGWETVAEKTFYGTASGTLSTKATSGTYRLEFDAAHKGQTYNIQGSLTK